jgi:hypothetical protein
MINSGVEMRGDEFSFFSDTHGARYQKLSFTLIVTIVFVSLILPKPIAKFEYPTQMSTLLPPLEVPALS